MICPICKKEIVKLCKTEIVKHIIKEGVRYHVHWWNGNGEHCSATNCEDNHGQGKCKKDGE